MTATTQTKLFAYLSQEFNIQALDSDMREIEIIVCQADIDLLNQAQAELRACYNRLGYQNSNVLQAIDERLDEILPLSEHIS